MSDFPVDLLEDRKRILGWKRYYFYGASFTYRMLKFFKNSLQNPRITSTRILRVKFYIKIVRHEAGSVACVRK